MKIGIIGMGWFGKPFAEFCLTHEHEVLGTKRSPMEMDSWQEGITLVPFEFQNCQPSDTLKKMLSFSDVLVFDIPPSAVAPEIFKKNFKSIANKISKSKIQKAIFISSTSVFSNEQGLVTEETIPSPDSNNGILLLALEEIWRSTLGPKGIVLRPGGLIGQDRHPVKYLSGRERLKGQNIPVNLVHQDDLVKMVFAIATTETNHNVFHAVANQHPEKKLFYQTVAEQRGLALPIFDESEKSAGKTVEAEKSKKSLGIKFDYDDPFKM
jgi:nucleoside-diphosphate-sugar epimerase